jgi:hypothetical protein
VSCTSSFWSVRHAHFDHYWYNIIINHKLDDMSTLNQSVNQSLIRLFINLFFITKITIKFIISLLFTKNNVEMFKKILIIIIIIRKKIQASIHVTEWTFFSLARQSKEKQAGIELWTENMVAFTSLKKKYCCKTKMASGCVKIRIHCSESESPGNHFMRSLDHSGCANGHKKVESPSADSRRMLVAIGKQIL